jgi:hypothetical protein
MKLPNLVTESIQHFYTAAFSLDVEILQYQTIFKEGTRQMEYYEKSEEKRNINKSQR